MIALITLLILINLYAIFKPLFKIFKLNYPDVTEYYFSPSIIEKIDDLPQIDNLEILNPFNYFNIQESDSKNKIIHKMRLRNSLVSIKNNNHYLLTNQEEVFSNLLKYKLVIVHLETFYNYTLNKIKEPFFIKYLAQYCNKNNIKLIVYGELNPDDIIKHLNNITYISPYHYYKGYFGYVYRLKDDGYNKEKIDVDIDNVLMDQIDLNKIDQNQLLYIANQKASYPNNITLTNLNLDEWSQYTNLDKVD